MFLNPPTDPGWCEPVGGDGLPPGPTGVRGERPGEAELGVSDDQDPGPAVRSLGSTEFRSGPAQGLLREAEGVLQIEAAEKCLPETVHILRGGAGLRGPQPHRRGIPVLRQMVDPQPHQHPFDRR